MVKLKAGYCCCCVVIFFVEVIQDPCCFLSSIIIIPLGHDHRHHYWNVFIIVVIICVIKKSTKKNDTTLSNLYQLFDIVDSLLLVGYSASALSVAPMPSHLLSSQPSTPSYLPSFQPSLQYLALELTQFFQSFYPFTYSSLYSSLLREDLIPSPSSTEGVAEIPPDSRGALCCAINCLDFFNPVSSIYQWMFDQTQIQSGTHQCNFIRNYLPLQVFEWGYQPTNPRQYELE